MRARFAALAIVSLLLPAALSAQRIPLIGIFGRHGRPEEMPPQPAPIVNELAYHRLNVSVESYPMVSFFTAPAFATNGRASSWASVGAGTRVDYRVNHIMSATLDLTSSLLGGPENVETVELGTRFRPERNERDRLYPFIDARVAYIATFSNALNGYGGLYFNDPYADSFYNGASYSHGYGIVGGPGLEYALTRSWSLITSAMVGRSTMRAAALNAPVNRSYQLTSIRYTLGLRYNPVRMIRAIDTK